MPEHLALPQLFTERRAVNCHKVLPGTLTTIMYGLGKHLFSGALKDKKGLFEEANNGTIFLDEIGEMAFELQAKLLRIIETGEYIKIGDTKPTHIDVRIIAATNRNLPAEIAAGAILLTGCESFSEKERTNDSASILISPVRSRKGGRCT